MTARGRYRSVKRSQFVTKDPIASLETGARLASQAGVPFALVGRLAVWFYVPPEGQQLTKDADLAVPYGHLPAVIGLANAQNHRGRALSIGGYGISAPGRAVDFIDRYPDLSELYADAVAAARRTRSLRLKVGRIAVPVVPVPYLITMKLVPHEPKDERDVQELLRLVKAADYPELRKLVRRYLGVASVMYLDSLARSIGHRGPGMKRRYRGEHGQSR